MNTGNYYGITHSLLTKKREAKIVLPTCTTANMLASCQLSRNVSPYISCRKP